MFIAAIYCICLLCISAAFACSGCGCRGGPGYRGPDGHCVGFANLKRVCGDPPETGCVKEGFAAIEEPACHVCSCKGGPGYRNPATGQCVSRRALAATCGNPPTKRCTPEGSALGAPKKEP
jgi:hypothetical protein